MNCPVDGSELRITERQGIEIDYCPQCRGVWLDRGELDKLIARDDDDWRDDDRSRDRDRYRYRDRDSDRDYASARYPGRKKRKGMLGELFDF